MANPKIVNGKITVLLKTFDGSYVKDTMHVDLAREMLDRAESDASVPGFELVCEPYRFETEQVEAKLTRKSKKDVDFDD